MLDSIRVEVERELRGRLTDEQWAWLETEHAADVIAGAMTARDLAAQVRKVRQRAQAGRRRQPAAQVIDDTTAALRPNHDALRQRTVAVALLIAHEARSDTEVVSFRKEVLRGRLVRWEGLGDWLKARAQAEGRGQPERRLPYFTHDDGWERQIPVAANGVLDRLKGIATTLVARYGMSEAQAVAFVLTDKPVVIEPLKWSVEVRTPITGATRITIEADPAMPPALIERAYRTARNRLIWVKGGRFKEIDPQRVRLAAWATTRPVNETPEQALAAWNRDVAKRKPEWKYDRLDYFTRDIKVSQRRLLRPDYHIDLWELSGGIEGLEEGKA